ncbi:hypothetical protein LRR81_17700 [Metabacillus sp. GX 13764]|uniref:hypothetical protein n=1 Tax=Metabacillus kandeliae TaxID=2900151 RepID=UPI001E32FBDE|nr:hypothetical protein [Metabacillus kandeliae]MCD7036079.1 hypothetical protein [Metabacillus kandeliae]
MNTFNESAIASYITSMAEKNCKQLDDQSLSDLDKGKLLGKMEAYNDFLDRFGFERVECSNIPLDQK